MSGCLGVAAGAGAEELEEGELVETGQGKPKRKREKPVRGRPLSQKLY